MEYASLFETDLGIGAVVATEQGVCQVVLPYSGSAAYVDQLRLRDFPASPLTRQAANMLTSYFRGEPQCFDNIPVDLGKLTEFRSRILRLIRSIPYGEVRSYSEVASMAAIPKAARAIGGAMASNPVPIIIPCHRVLATNGRLTGYSAPGGLAVKKIFLLMEGVEFKGEVVCQKKIVINKGKLA